MGFDVSSKPLAEAVMPSSTYTTQECLPATPVSALESNSKVPDSVCSDIIKSCRGIFDCMLLITEDRLKIVRFLFQGPLYAPPHDLPASPDIAET